MKKIIFLFTLIFCFTNLWSENDKIELPELTTVVSTNTIDEENVQVPDFNDVVKIPEGSGDLVPSLPEIDVEKKENYSYQNVQTSSKSLFMEGLIGGGYPTAFVGNFKISKLDKDSPFTISFNHNSLNGYGGQSINDLYNFRNNLIDIDKIFAWDNFKFELIGKYEDKGNGLQHKNDNLANINQELFSLGLSGLWNFNKWDLSVGVKPDYYFRYLDITKTSDETFTCPDNIKYESFFDIEPYISSVYKNNNFSFNSYLNSNFGNNNYSRFELGSTLNYDFKNLKTSGSLAFVFGNYLGNNTFTVPFNLSLITNIPVSFSDRKIDVFLQGGLISSLQKTYELEENNLFTACNLAANEQSDWFCNFSILLPVKTHFAAQANIEFRKTALNNKLISPVYEQSYLNSGLYQYDAFERTEFNTGLNFIYTYKILTLSAQWITYWNYVPVLQNQNSLDLNIALQKSDSLWGFNADTKLLFAGQDKTPVLNLEGFYKLSDATKIVLNCNDVLKLFSKNNRTYKGQYIQESGSVKLSVKFVF